MNQIENLIREGKTSEARKILLELLAKKVDDGSRFRLAALARRLSLPFEALKLLRSLVHPTGRKVVVASVKEKAEYAAALEKVGANHEAIQILKKLDATEYPEIYLYRAFSYFAQWNYQDAIPELEKYLDNAKLDVNQRIVGLSNYAAALIYERDGRADLVLTELVEKSKTQNYRLALGYAYLLQVEKAVYERAWDELDSKLNQAVHIFNENDLLENLLVEKWRAVGALYRYGITEETLKSLDAIKALARKFKHWETLRDCEFHFAVISKEEKALNRVYYGSPYQKLRKRLIGDSGVTLPTVSTYLHGKPLLENEEYAVALPLRKFKESAVERGELLSSLTSLLFSDFYRPFRVAEIHATLFPDDYFNPITSPNKIYQVIFRFKSQINTHQIPLVLEEVDGAYRLRPKKGYAVLIPYNLSSLNQKVEWKNTILANFPCGTSFSLSQAKTLLSQSERTLQRLFAEWVENGTLVKTGKAKNTRYVFTESEAATAKMAG